MIVLSGNPYSTNNIYCRRGHRGFIKTKPRLQKESYREQAEIQWHGGILKDDVEVYIKLYFGDKRKRDWDNYHKLAMDALTGIVWEDDSQIQTANVQKFYSKENPRIEININPI